MSLGRRSSVSDLTRVNADTDHEFAVGQMRDLEVLHHVEDVEGESGDLARVPDAVGAWTAAHDHVGVADRLHLVHVVQVDATVELRVQLVEERHHLGGIRMRITVYPATD